MKKFFETLAYLSSSETDHQIASLVYRLDFNDYYSKGSKGTAAQ